MKHMLRSATLVTVAFHVNGCVAPGSSIGSVSIRGTLSAEGEPLAGAAGAILLPASYGLGGPDLVMNKPEDFGRKDDQFPFMTDSDGHFQLNLGKRIYHVSCWLLPPVGCYPKRAPPPLVLVRVDAAPEEYYAVQTHDGQFRVYDKAGRALPLKQARLRQLSAQSEPGDSETRETIGVIGIDVGRE